MSDERPLSEELFHQANRVCNGKDTNAGLLARCGHRAAALEAEVAELREKLARAEAKLEEAWAKAPTTGF